MKQNKEVDYDAVSAPVPVQDWYALFFKDVDRVKVKDVIAAPVACWVCAKLGSIKKSYVVGLVPLTDGPLSPANVDADFRGYARLEDDENVTSMIKRSVAGWNAYNTSEDDEDDEDDSDEEDEDEDDED